MIALMAWTDRHFNFDQPIGIFPALLERLRGTPARAEEMIAGCSEAMLGRRVGGKWSVKEQLGHLVALHPLDDKRLREYREKASVLSAADMTNRATQDARYGEQAIADILKRLRTGRHDLVRNLERLTGDEIAATALHPRLQKPMRLLDWVYFIAEHDDHHLAQARRTMQELKGN